MPSNQFLEKVDTLQTEVTWYDHGLPLQYMGVNKLSGELTSLLDQVLATTLPPDTF